MSRRRQIISALSLMSILSAINLGMLASAEAAATGALSFTAAKYGALQNIGVKLIGISRTGGSSGAASVVCTTVNNTALAGVEYTMLTHTLTWANGDGTTKYCDVPILNKEPFAGTRTFFVELSGATGAALGTTAKTTVTIYGDEQNSTVSLSSAAYSVNQKTTSLTISVARTGYSGGKATVGYATANNSAVAGTDYTSERGVLAWNYGDSASKTFVIPISNAKPFTGNKTLAVALAGATGTAVGTASAVVTIAGDAAVTTPPVTTPPVTTPPVTTPPVTTPPVTPPPVTPPQVGLPSGPTFKFTTAPTLTGVSMVQNRDSVIVQFPAVANARDFRVLVAPTAVAGSTGGTESVTGGTQFCAGIRQHQARTRFVADNVTKFPYYFYLNTEFVDPATIVPNFFSPPPGAWSLNDLDTPPNLQVEVTGVTSSMTVTVEALDRLCPFPGIIGRSHQDIVLTHSSDVDHPGNPWLDASSVVTFPVVTEAEVIAKYGSLIMNGQGWAGGPNVQANPPAAGPFAQPAPVNPPVVLARAAVTIAPLAAPPAPPATFFDDFSNASDTFQTMPLPKWTYPRYATGEMVLQNSKWTVYGNGFTCCSPTATANNKGYADAYVENGVLNTLLGDQGQDVLSEITMVPRTAAHLNATTYLHVTYEVASYATSRRYWAVTLCGSSTAGQTLDSTGALKEQVVHTTFFYQNTGASPSTAGWNCLQIFNRQGNSNAFSQWEAMYNINGSRAAVPANKGVYDFADYIYNAIPSIANPAQTAAYTVHPESDVLVLVNKPIPAAGLPEVLGNNEQVVQSQYTSPINVSPLQLDNPAGEIAWFYSVDKNGNPAAPILDDQQLVAPRTKYDLYIRNNRIIMYANGTARLCNDFTTPTTTLNIADAAVGFHEVLYHSSGEFGERMEDPDRGAAYYYRLNSPWIDQRSWDNMGFEENTMPPADFNAATCFEHKSLGTENNEP